MLVLKMIKGFFEFIKSDKNGQVSILTVKPNQIRGNHYHMTKVEKFLILSEKESLFQKFNFSC